MFAKPELRTRAGTIADAAAIVEIYNQGIADRTATFETEPRSVADIAEWFTRRHLVAVAETDQAGLVAFAASFPYSTRACYRGIGEFSVYARRDYRGRGAGRAALAALIEAAAAQGMHKLTSRVFPENVASRALLKGLGFAEIGMHRHHGRLDGRWRDCVIVELLLPKDDTPGPPLEWSLPDVSAQERWAAGGEPPSIEPAPELSSTVHKISLDKPPR
jgi:phosphinothricin acetyltransferase